MVYLCFPAGADLAQQTSARLLQHNNKTSNSAAQIYGLRRPKHAAYLSAADEHAAPVLWQPPPLQSGLKHRRLHQVIWHVTVDVQGHGQAGQLLLLRLLLLG